MSEFRRRLMMAGSGGNDGEQIDALLFPEGSYIDTGYYPKGDLTTIECNVAVFNNNTYCDIFGCKTSNNSLYYVAEGHGSAMEFWYNSGKVTTVGYEKGLMINIIAEPGKFTYNGNSYTFPISTFTMPRSLYINGMNISDTDSGSNVKISLTKFVIRENTEIIKNYIPWKKGNVCGLLDTISGEFLTSASSVELKEAHKYLYFNSSPYFDTGVIPTINTSAEYEYFITSRVYTYGPHFMGGSKTWFPFIRGNNQIVSQVAGSQSVFEHSIEYLKKYHFEAFRNGHDIYLDGEYIGTVDVGTDWGNSMYVGVYRVNPTNNQFILRGGVKYINIYEGSTLIRHYVPHTHNGVVGALDLVNNTFSISATNVPFSITYFE